MALEITKNSQAKSPPKKSTPNKAAGDTVVSQSRLEVREEGVKGLFDLGAAVALMLRQPADAGACIVHGPGVAHEVAVFAEQDEKVGALIDKITAAGPYAALLTAILPFGLQIAANHGAVKAEMLTQFGVMTPEALQARAAAESLKQQAKLMREQAEAEADFAAAQLEAAQAAQQLTQQRSTDGGESNAA